MQDQTTDNKTKSKDNKVMSPNGLQPQKYQSRYKVRFITAASLFDGHDASINIMRRILQSTGAEVIHLGHNRSVHEIVNCAIQEDAQGIAISSYQGGHVEYFKYMVDLLKENNASHIRVYGGGGGVIVGDEIDELHDYGVSRIFSVDDGSNMGLQGMINDVLKQSDFPVGKDLSVKKEDVFKGNHQAIAQMISAAENFPDKISDQLKELNKECKKTDCRYFPH